MISFIEYFSASESGDHLYGQAQVLHKCTQHDWDEFYSLDEKTETTISKDEWPEDWKNQFYCLDYNDEQIVKTI